MDKKINFSQEEIQLLYAACMNYRDKLYETRRSISYDMEINFDSLERRAEESAKLAIKITEYMEE